MTAPAVNFSIEKTVPACYNAFTVWAPALLEL